MSRPPRAALLATAAAAGLLLTFVVLWLGVSRLSVGRSDFTSVYAGATLLREGHGAQLYDLDAQAAVHATLLAPGDHEGNLPYLNPPGAAALALPVSLLDLPTAYRVWSLLQLVLVGLGVAAAVRAAPWPARLPRGVRLAAWGIGAAGMGTLSTLMLGQWDGLLTLGVGMAYWSWRRSRPEAAGAWLAAVALIAKPHLFLGVAAFLLLRRERRALLGAGATALALAVLSFALVGPSGVAGFVHISVSDLGRWSPSEMLGFSGLFGSWLGASATAHVLTTLATLGAVVASGVLGARSRDPHKFETALAGTLALSLLSAPHLYGHDLVLLAPAVAWMLGRAAAADGAMAWPGTRTRGMLLVWLMVNLAAWMDFSDRGPAPPGRVVPLALLGVGLLALRATGRSAAAQQRVALQS